MGKVNITIHNDKLCKNCIWLDDLCESGYFGDREAPYSVFSSEVNSAVTATDEHGHIVGLWRFDKYYNTIYSRGTWVSPKFRKYGIAKKLWTTGIKFFKPKKIQVDVVSDKGYTLICALSDKFSNINWDVECRGHRKLRKLKKVRRGTA